MLCSSKLLIIVVVAGVQETLSALHLAICRAVYGLAGLTTSRPIPSTTAWYHKDAACSGQSSELIQFV